MEIVSNPTERKLLIEGTYQPIYSSFGLRLGAYFIGFMMFALIYMLITMFEDAPGDRTIQTAIIWMLFTAYKPLMEWIYGATLTKRWLGIKVVDKEFKKPNFKQALLRNIFNIVPSVIFFLSVLFDANGGFYKNYKYDPDNINSNNNLGNFTPAFFVFIGELILVFALFAADSIFIMADEKGRSLHNRIASTYVIMNKK